MTLVLFITIKQGIMNNFDIVLTAIRQNCEKGIVPQSDCFDLVKAELKLKDEEGIDFYLDFLQDLGLIKYNYSNRLITLTERGRHTDRLFN